LFRHGIAVAREDWHGEDAQRPLTKKGENRVRQAAEGLVTLDIRATHILTSPFLRSHETAQILYHVLKVKTSPRICDELIPDSPPDKVFPLLATLPNDATLICVGHEPHLSEAASLMLFGKPTAALSMKKAGACLITFAETPRPGRGLLEWWMPPSHIRALRGG
jgi:phosphohistidine phosphatase